MTLRLPEQHVRELYERWRRGEVSLRGAAREMGVEARVLQRRWARYDGEVREKMDRAKIADVLRKNRREQWR